MRAVLRAVTTTATHYDEAVAEFADAASLGRQALAEYWAGEAMRLHAMLLDLIEGANRRYEALALTDRRDAPAQPVDGP
jgi:hypothetical protein